MKSGPDLGLWVSIRLARRSPEGGADQRVEGGATQIGFRFSDGGGGFGGAEAEVEEGGIASAAPRPLRVDRLPNAGLPSRAGGLILRRRQE